MTSHDAGPLVSVVMSNYRGVAHLEAAIVSVLAQTHRHLELIVADDASDDGSGAILKRMAESDTRLRPIFLATNGGPGRARNAALDAAHGAWIAIVDADDLIHPLRIERLLRAATVTGAQMIADDPVYFGSLESAGRTLLQDHAIQFALRIEPVDLVRSDTDHSGRSSLGYLKPMIRAERLSHLRYDPDLRIGEDFDLYLRLLLEGARFFALPDPTYLYRRHAGSISHRLSANASQGLIGAQARIVRSARAMRPDDGPLHAALKDRGRALDRAARYAGLVDAIKAGRFMHSAARIARHPRLIGDLRASLTDRRRRTALAPSDGDAARRTVVLAAPGRLDGIPAPPDAIRIAVPPMRDPAMPNGDTHAALACRLAVLASRGPLDIVADGAAGRHAASYLPPGASV